MNQMRMPTRSWPRCRFVAKLLEAAALGHNARVSTPTRQLLLLLALLLFGLHGHELAQQLELQVEQLLVSPILLLPLFLCARKVLHQQRVPGACPDEALGNSSGWSCCQIDRLRFSWQVLTEMDFFVGRVDYPIEELEVALLDGSFKGSAASPLCSD
jgi:hypothetical protein